VGLVQRSLEAAGFSTITLSFIPDLTASVGVPRLVGIEHPAGVPFGMPGDRTGQAAILRATLDALVQMHTPGERIDLPVTWVEPAPEVSFQPPETPPIGQYLRRHIWDLPRFLRRDPPGN
jgi:hypothetical protein